MDKQFFQLLLGVCLLITIIITFYVSFGDRPVPVASKLGNRIATVLPHADMTIADYDDVFLDPHSEKISSGGVIWEGMNVDPQNSQRTINLTAVTDTTSWLEVQCDEPSRAIGVHFWGNEDDGWAKVIVDNDYEWAGDTWNTNQYIEITSLPETRHTIRIEALGIKGNDGNSQDIHVTVAGIDCAPSISKGILYRFFLPLVWG